MGRKKGTVIDEGPGRASSEESGDSLDIVDQISRDIGFLAEALRLLQVASLRREEWRDVSIGNVTEEMIVKLERLERLFSRFQHSGGKEGERA